MLTDMSIQDTLIRATPEPIKRILRPFRNKFVGNGRIAKDSFQLNFWRSRLEIDGGRFENYHYERLMLAMSEEGTQSFIKGRIIADFGCGPRGSLVWADSALIRIGIDVLADRYADAFRDNITSHNMIYLKCTEKVIPLPSEFIDVMFTMQAMSYVENFRSMCNEILRVLKPGGELIGSFHLERPASRMEPQQLNETMIKEYLLNHLEVHSYRVTEMGNEGDETYAPFFKGNLSYRAGQQGMLWARARKPS
jgi:SAM-dependent methyltransferase